MTIQPQLAINGTGSSNGHDAGLDALGDLAGVAGLIASQPERFALKSGDRDIQEQTQKAMKQVFDLGE